MNAARGLRGDTPRLARAAVPPAAPVPSDELRRGGRTACIWGTSPSRSCRGKSRSSRRVSEPLPRSSSGRAKGGTDSLPRRRTSDRASLLNRPRCLPARMDFAISDEHVWDGLCDRDRHHQRIARPGVLHEVRRRRPFLQAVAAQPVGSPPAHLRPLLQLHSVLAD